MNFTLQRHAVRVTSFDEERREHATLTLWRSRPVEERLAAVEFLRKQFMDLAPDFNEFIGSLNAHGVEFLIVGAYALAEFEPVQIHVMTAISGVSWDQAWAGHVMAGIGDFAVVPTG